MEFARAWRALPAEHHKEGDLVFGYIRPQKFELRVREYEQYRAVYCSLCRQLGDRYGIFARMTLSYDCTFYALWMMALHKRCPSFQEGRCVVNPMKKCGFCTGGERELRLASALSVIMVYQKVRDNIADDRFLKRLRSYFMLPFVSRMRRKAERDYPELDKIVALATMEQAAAEQNPGKSIDFYAEPSAKMMEQVFAFGAEAPELSPEDRLVRQAGYFLGRWVYIIDAADDLEKDLREGAFNPFIVTKQLQSNCSPERLKEVKAEANQILNATLSQLIALVTLMDLQPFGSIVTDVLFLGLPEMQRAILFEKEKEKHVGPV